MQMHNFAVSLGHCGFADEAREWAEKAYEKNPLKLSSLHILIQLAFVSGDLNNIEQRLKEWREKTGKPHEYEADLLEDLEDLHTAEGALEDFEHHGGGMTLDEMAKRYQL